MTCVEEISGKTMVQCVDSQTVVEDELDVDDVSFPYSFFDKQPADLTLVKRVCDKCGSHNGRRTKRFS